MTEYQWKVIIALIRVTLGILFEGSHTISPKNPNVLILKECLERNK